LGGHSTWLVAFTIATSRSYKKKGSGQQSEPTDPWSLPLPGTARVWMNSTTTLGAQKKNKIKSGEAGEEFVDRRRTLKSELRLARLTVVVSLMAP
jgi:hypothetical protein